MAAQDSNPLVSSIQWLEEEHRQSKATAFKVQQQIDQVQAGLWAQSDRVHQLEQTTAALNAQTSRIAKLEDELRHARDLIERLQEAQSAEVERWAAAERARLAEQERGRQEMAQIFHKLEEIEREGLFVRTRLGVLDEGIRRVQEQVTVIVQRLDDHAQEHEALHSRLQNLQEQLKRKDQDIARLDGQQDALHKQDELQLSRLQVLVEQVRRVEDMGPLRDLEERLSREYSEKLELHRMERQRVERLVGDLSIHQEQQRNRVEEIAQLASQVEAKASSQVDYINQIREQLWSLRDEVSVQFAEAVRLEEHQKRRVLADLEQQLLELKTRAARMIGTRPSV